MSLNISAISSFLDTRVCINNGYWQRSGIINNLCINTLVCINNGYWQSSGIINNLCKYIIVISYTDRLLDAVFLLLAVMLSGLHENPGRKDSVTEKSAETNFCEGITIMAVRPSSCIFFVTLFVECHLSFTPILRRKNIFCSKKWMEDPLPTLPTALLLYSWCIFYEPYLVLTK